MDYFVVVVAAGGEGYVAAKINVAGIPESINVKGGVLSLDTGILLNDTHRINLEYISKIVR